MKEHSSEQQARLIASDLLAIGAVLIQPEDPFTWASGRRSPIYCDNRLTMAYPEIRSRIAEGFQREIESRTLAPDVIVGTATAGIPHAAFLAERMRLPMAYVRSSAKAHGKGNQVEGKLEPGQRVVVVEDLISTGGSSRSVVEALREGGATVAAVLAIFTYGFPESERAFADLSVPLITLSGYDVLIQVALEQQRFAPDQLESLSQWRDDPVAWSERVQG